jgi:nitrous oxide reductase accessory protein NosL
MLEHAKTKIGKGNIVAYFATDFPTQKWIEADKAQFVKSDKFQTPRNGGILAFQDKAKAEALAAQYQAKLVSLEELLK